MIWLILVAGLILRLINLNQSLGLDEAINVIASQNYSFNDLIFEYAKADFHPPGWFIILWIWIKIFGANEIVVRIPSVFFGTLTVGIVYLIGKKLNSAKLGLVAAFLIAINSLHIYYSQEARMYALAAFAVSINILALLKFIKGEKLGYAYFITSSILVLLSDYVAYFIFPAQFIFLLIFKKSFIKKWIPSIIAATLSGIWWLPTFLAQLDVGAVASASLPTWRFVVGGFDFKTIPLTFVKFIIGRISIDNKLIYGSLMLPICSFSLYLIYKGTRISDSISKKLLLSWVVLPILIASIVSIAIPVYSYFRVLYVLPGFIILVSSGILSFKKKLSVLLFTLVILIEITCTLTYLLNPSFHREDWKGVVSFLSNQKSSTILFESSGMLPPFEYYAANRLNAKGALKDFPAKTDKDVEGLDDLLSQVKDVYLIEYLVQISDPNRLVQKKLNELNFMEDKIYNFRGVGLVFHYVKK